MTRAKGKKVSKLAAKAAAPSTEHLQVQVNTNPHADVFAPQEVIDALVMLIKVGLLDWKEGVTQPRFSLYGLILDHDANSEEDMGAGFRMHVTREQADAIGKAVKQEREAFAKAQIA